MKRLPPRRRRGFTLIEVLLVLVILVILASLVTVNIIKSQKQANLNAARLQAHAIAEAVKNYNVDVMSLPSPAVGLDALLQRPADLSPSANWQGPYLEKPPMDPWGQRYQYRCPGVHNPQTFDIFTMSSDGVEVGNWDERQP